MSIAGAVALDAADVLDVLLQHASPTGAVESATRALAGLAQNAGFATRIDHAGSVVMSWGDTGAPIAGAIVLLGHLDTVPGGPPARQSNGRLHGRGSVDAKGPLAAALAAVSRLPRTGRRVTIVAAIDEEGPSECAQALSSSAPASHLIVLEPSGWDTITVGYRGCVRVRLSVEQESAHHALPRPSAGDRVVAGLIGLQQHLGSLVADLRRAAGDRAVDRLQVRVNRISSREDGSVERADADVEIRLPTGVSVDDVLGRISAGCVDVDVVVESACPPVMVARSNATCRALARAVSSAGGSVRYTTKTGTSDLNVVMPAWRCPGAVYGPGDSSLDHTPNESVEIDELRRGSRVLEHAVAWLR